MRKQCVPGASPFFACAGDEASWGPRVVLEHPRDIISNSFGLVCYHWQYKIWAVPPWQTLRAGPVTIILTQAYLPLTVCCHMGSHKMKGTDSGIYHVARQLSDMANITYVISPS